MESLQHVFARMPADPPGRQRCVPLQDLSRCPVCYGFHIAGVPDPVRRLPCPNVSASMHCTAEDIR